jgi:RNA polymerase sigma-70 factor, ECF subfamily
MDTRTAADHPGLGADWGAFLSSYRDRLRRMVALRLDHRLRGRIDPSDVIQEAFLEATGRRAEYERQSDPMPPFLWLRFLTLQQLQLVHRRQLGTRARDAGREVSIHAAFRAEAESVLAGPDGELPEDVFTPAQ